MNCSRHSRLIRLVGGLAFLGAMPFAHSVPGEGTSGGGAPLVPLYLVGQEEELLAIPGIVQAARRSELAFRFSGLLVELPVVAGQRVAAGDVLARLDPRDFEARVLLEQARLNLARADFDRSSRLIRSRASPVSEADVDRRRSQFEIAGVRTAQARKNLADTTLRAPFGGVVAARLVDNHTQVGANQAILQLETPDKLEVVIDLPERVVSRVRSAPRRPAARRGTACSSPRAALSGHVGRDRDPCRPDIADIPGDAGDGAPRGCQCPARHDRDGLRTGRYCRR